MIEDVVQALGYLTLGTRLKRLGERLQAQTQALIEAGSVAVPASHFPLLAALHRLGALSVGELTEALGTSQPGVTRMLDNLEGDGLVQSTQSRGDRRVRTIELTRVGRQLVSRSQREIWPRIEASVSDACGGAAQPLLSALSALEAALATASLSARTARLSQRKEGHARA